jgi:signal transduction histidine kinase
MRDLSANKDIVYCVLQDTIGIVAASENILELSRINHDEMLRATWLDSNFRHREFSFDGTEVIESFTTISTVQGKFLLRLALSTEKSMNIYSRAVNRTVLIAVGLFISGFIMINFIISRRKILSLEEQHDNLQNHLDLIMSNITDAVIVLNSDFTFRFFNNAAKELLAIENKNCVGEKYSSVFPDDIFQIKSVEYPGGKSRLNEITLKLGNQEKHIVYSVSLLSYRNENQNIIIIIKDMTDIRALRERLRQQDKMTAIGQLAAGVAHEIRNPLSAVNIIAQRFELEFIPENDKEEYMQLTGTVRNEIGRVNEIIKQFLEFAKPTAIHRNKRNIADLLNNIVNLIKPLCDKGAIEIETDLNSIEAEIDSDKMTQAILNLCNNAIEAMPEGGRLTLSSSLQNDSAIIQIEDTGIGIPEEHKNKIFNLYFSTKQHGTGLGLSIVYQIVSEHGGDIKVESAPHSGTKFIINLPM